MKSERLSLLINELKKSLELPVALLLAKNWPEPGSTAAGRRTLDVLDLVREAGYRVEIASPAEPTPFQADLASLGYPTHAIAVNDCGFDHWVSELNPALVIFDRFVMEEQFGWRIQTQCPEAMTLLDTSDFHSLREARHQALKTGQPLNLFNDTAVRELAAMARCDLTLMISQVEIELLRQHFQIPADRLLYLPFLIKNLPDPAQWASFNDRQHLVMIGGFKHAPNRDAVQWFQQAVWPEVRSRLPSVECHVFGAYADHAVQQWHQPKTGFHIRGRAEDALKTIETYRLNLAPLRFGAGQKGKILEGWLTGTPTVTTPVGIESMADPEALGYRPSDDPDQIADAIVDLYQHENRWRVVQQHGLAALKSHFLHQHHAKGFTQRLQTTADRLQQHRQGYIWGRILWQNQYRATEYMSRWIEAKNR